MRGHKEIFGNEEADKECEYEKFLDEPAADQHAPLGVEQRKTMIKTAQNQKRTKQLIKCGLRGACGAEGGSGSVSLHLSARMGDTAVEDWTEDPEQPATDDFNILAKTTFTNGLEME